MAGVVVESSHNLGAKTQIQRKIGAGLPVVLHKETIIVVAVLVIEDPAASKTPSGRTFEEVLEISLSIGSGSEEELAIKDSGGTFCPD